MVGAVPRIGVASLVQETNTFSPKPTEWEDFTVLVGADAEVALEGTNTEFAGAVSELRQQGADYVPLVAAWALPSGRVTDTTFSQLSELLDASIKQAGELDDWSCRCTGHGAKAL